MSIADMLREAAQDVLRQRVPEGFEYIQEYGQYYSRECGYFFDPNTNLFFHSESQTYYIFNDDTQSYEVYMNLRKTKWKVKKNKQRALQLYGEASTSMAQEHIDVLELLFEVVDAVTCQVDEIEPNELNDVSSSSFKRRASKQVFDAHLGEFIDVFEEDRANLSGVSDSSEDEDEREQMMREEGMNEAPMLRVMQLNDDGSSELHIVTISGSTAGSHPKCDIRIDTHSKRLAEFCFFPELNSYMLLKCGLERVLVNDSELSNDENRALEHGDQLRLADNSFVVHIHHGSNMCPGCIAGARATTVDQQQYVPRGEAARRMNMKSMREQLGLNYNSPPHGERENYDDRAKKRRKEVGSVYDLKKAQSKNASTSGDMYAECSARPVPGATAPLTKSIAEKQIGEENKGFRLLKGMGWKEGEGLGKESKGRVDPVKNEMRQERAGLGSSVPVPKTAPVNSRREDILRKTQERYKAAEHAEN